MPPSLKPYLTRLLSEALLVLLALLALLALAHPLSDPAARDGLNGRYALADTASVTTAAIPVTAPDPRQLRAREKLAHPASYLVWLASTGLLVLWLGRSSIPVVGFAMLGTAAWSGCASVVHPYGMENTPAVWLALGLFLSTPVLARRFPARQPRQEIASVWAYPGFLFLTGLGYLWLLDYAARGYPKHAYLGVAHGDVLFLAYTAMTLLAGLTPTLLDVLARFAARLDRTTGAADKRAKGWASALALAWLVAIFVVVWGKTDGQVLKAGEKAAAITSEMLRAPVWVTLGWICYRWLDCGRRPSRAAPGMFIASAVLVLGLAATNDKGQVLLYSLASVLLLAALVGFAAAPSGTSEPTAGRSRSVLLMAAGLALTGVLAVFWMLERYGPSFSDTIAQREVARNQPFAAHLIHLAQLRWFSDGLPASGFGLTHVPWCGYLGSLGGRCDGVPEQLVSDYAFFGIAGVWGSAAAYATTLLTMAWLVSLLALPAGGLPARSLNRLGRWVVAMFVAASLVQLLLTTLGSLGTIALTGVTFPLVSFGGASLLATAVFAALSINAIQEN